MSYISNKISGLQTQTTFTTKVIQDNSKRYANSTFKNETFTVGREYTGINLYKGLNRPPKLRILAIFKPLINGNPNSINDTYVAFSVYDYTLSRFRGPACRRSQPDSQVVYNDYYVTTIDKFGKNYGNVFTSDSGSTITSFTAPTPDFSPTLQTTLTSGISVTISNGHYTGCYTFAGPNNTTIDFNGFLRIAGYNGTYCFYTLGESGSPKQFRNTLNSGTYTNNTAPYYTPATSKFVSEWRCSPICNLNNAGYTPLVRPINRGQIKYVLGSNPDPLTAFTNGNIIPTEIWVQVDYDNYLPFFGGRLFANEGGVQGASGYAPAGYYGVSDYNAYGYWDGAGNWGSFVDYSGGGGGGGANLVDFIFLGPYFDPFSACVEDGRAQPIVGYIDTNVSAQPDAGQIIYEADGVTLSPLQPGAWYKVFDNTNTPLGYAITVDPSATIDNKFRCE